MRRVERMQHNALEFAYALGNACDGRGIAKQSTRQIGRVISVAIGNDNDVLFVRAHVPALEKTEVILIHWMVHTDNVSRPRHQQCALRIVIKRGQPGP